MNISFDGVMLGIPDEGNAALCRYDSLWLGLSVFGVSSVVVGSRHPLCRFKRQLPT